MFITRPKSKIGQNKFGNECLKIEELADSFYRQFMIYRKKLLLTPPQCVLEIAQFGDLCKGILNSYSWSGKQGPWS